MPFYLLSLLAFLAACTSRPALRVEEPIPEAPPENIPEDFPFPEETYTAMDLVIQRVKRNGGDIKKYFLLAEYYNYQSAIGYTFLYYVTRMHNNPDIKLLPINGIAPSKETIQSRSYPLVKDIYAITIEGRETENTRQFIQWMLGEQGQYLVEKTGYVRN